MMRRHALMIILGVCLSALAVAAIVGCSSSNTSGDSPNTGSGMMGDSGLGSSPGGSNGRSGGGMMGRGGSSANSYASVGERIYLSGVGTDGRAISHTAARVSQGSLMMGGGGCGSCHGANGRGGTIRMTIGTAIKAPDVTYDALIKAGFQDATIRRAIRDGLDESGKPLKDAMPRWQMSEADLGATIAYLKVLGGR